MSPSRRRLLAGIGATGLAGLAGCSTLDVVAGDEPVRFAADAATVADGTLSETGYELSQVTEPTETREFEAAGRTREVEVTSVVAEYDRAVELFGERYQAAVFTALSTPQVEVLGRTFNPVGDMSDRELAGTIQERYETVESLQRESEYGTDVFGTRTTVGQYSAEGRLAGSDVTVDLGLHVASPVEAGDDFVVGLGAYPQLLGDGDAVRRLLDGIVHDAG